MKFGSPGTDQLNDWDFPVLDFAGGLNTKSSPYLLGKDSPYSLQANELVLLHNMDRNESGALTTRFGYAKLNSVAVAPPGGDAVIRSIYDYSKLSGAAHIVINAGNSIYRFDGTNFVSIGTTTTPNRKYSWTKMNDVLIGTNGVDDPIKWDGTTFALLGGSPPTAAPIVVTYREHVIFAKGLTIYYSAIGTIEDYTTAGNAGSLPLPAIKGTRITAMLPFFDRLIIWTDHEIFALRGTGDADFAFDVISYEIGHTACFEGVIPMDNDVLFQNERGIGRLEVTEAGTELGVLEERYASARIEPTWKALSLTNMPFRCAVEDQVNSLIIFLVGDTLQNNKALVADIYHRDAQGNPTWAEYTNYGFASGHNVHSINPGTIDVLLGGFDGFVYRKTGALDNSEEIPLKLSYVTHVNKPEWEKLIRWLVLFVINVDPISASEPFTVNAISDFGERSLNVVPQLSNVSTKKLGIDWILGVDPLYSPVLSTPKVAVPSIARYLTLIFTYKGASRITFNGFIIYGSHRRLIR